MKGQEWWRQEGAEEIYRGESNGQEFLSVFCGIDQGTGTHVYAVVRCSDGDYVEHVFGGVELSNGEAMPIPAD